MPHLDVSDLLTDPDFADASLVRYRRTETVDADGFGQAATATLPFSGVVTSESGRNLQRTPEATRTFAGIMIHTKTNLIEGDEVAWRGAAYIVRTVDDYSTYGAGFVAAICDLKPVNP